MLYFCSYVQLRRGSVAGYATDESWAYGRKESVKAFKSMTSYNDVLYMRLFFEHLLNSLADWKK